MQTIAIRHGLYLGPARVVDALPDGRLRVAFSDQEVEAAVAVAPPYKPSAGDTVLVTGLDDCWYVIGVLHATGDVRLAVPANLVLEAPNGRIDLDAGEGVGIRAAAVDVLASKLLLRARSLTERFESVTRWVTGVFHERCGTRFIEALKMFAVKAERIDQRARRDVKFDGERIHLG